MNPSDLIRERLEACFIFCSYAAHEIRHELGVRHLSQVWTKSPSWYLWLDSVPGAYMLELTGGAEFSLHGEQCYGAQAVVRYFPPEETGKSITDGVRHGIFDQTGTPVWEEIANIVGTERFVVGGLELHCSYDSDALYLVYERKTASDAEDIGRSLFEALVGMQAYFVQHPPEGPFKWGQYDGMAAAFGGSLASREFFKEYLAEDVLIEPDVNNALAASWSDLAQRIPVAAEGTGCCCCH